MDDYGDRIKGLEWSSGRFICVSDEMEDISIAHFWSLATACRTALPVTHRAVPNTGHNFSWQRLSRIKCHFCFVHWTLREKVDPLMRSSSIYRFVLSVDLGSNISVSGCGTSESLICNLVTTYTIHVYVLTGGLCVHATYIRIENRAVRVPLHTSNIVQLMTYPHKCSPLLFFLLLMLYRMAFS